MAAPYCCHKRRQRQRLCYSVISFLAVTSIVSASLPSSSSLVSKQVSPGGSTETLSKKQHDAYSQLASALLPRLRHEQESHSFRVTVESIQKALRSLAAAQGALKRLDGASHELYQRTHSTNEAKKDLTVKGRAVRSAARTGCTADALLGAELLDLFEQQQSDLNETLDGRQVLYNATLATRIPMSVVVLYEEIYSGGAGLAHGGIDNLLLVSTVSTARKQRGRLLILLKDGCNTLESTLRILDTEPHYLKLKMELMSKEFASVNRLLWECAGEVLEAVRPVLVQYFKKDTNNTVSNSERIIGHEDKEETRLPAVHFVGRSLAGGVSALACTILEGSLPMPGESVRGKGNRKRSSSNKKFNSNTTDKRRSHERSNRNDKEITTNDDLKEVRTGNVNRDFSHVSLEGYGKGHSSALTLGAPPCISRNVGTAFVTSVVHGDDVICRTTRDSLDRLCARTTRAMKGGVLGRKVGWMTDAISLTVSSLKSHAHGSEGEEARLSVPGNVFLVRPRRLGKKSSMHEVGDVSGGREALRAAVLWQLNDVLLSKSLWTHHSLEAYIHGLDRVQLRDFGSDRNEEEA